MKMKYAIFATITVFLSSIMMFALAEIGIRMVAKINGVDPRYTQNLPEVLAVPSGYFNYDLNPDVSFLAYSNNPTRFSIDHFGFRSPDYDPIKPENTLRIFFFGGSSTFDPYVSNENSWTLLTGEKLSKHTDKKIEAVNAGKYGFSSYEIFGLFYHRAMRHSPDVVVFYLTSNDEDAWVSPYHGADERPQLYGNPVLSMFNKYSALFTYLDVRFRYTTFARTFAGEVYRKILPNHFYVKEPTPEHLAYVSDRPKFLEYSNQQFDRNIRTMVKMAREQNVKVLISTQLIRRDSRSKVTEMWTETLRNIAREENVPLLDMFKLELNDQLEKDLLMTYVHLTEKGCEFLSDKMAEKILESNLLDL